MPSYLLYPYSRFEIEYTFFRLGLLRVSTDVLRRSPAYIELTHNYLKATAIPGKDSA